ncbi:MAG: RNA polymerase sigma factor [Butyricimonas faecihominis]
MHDDELRFISDINTKKEIAWKKLYHNYYPALCNYAAQITHNEVNVEDIVQECLISLWDSSVSFPNVKTLTSWLYKSVYTRSLNSLRDQTRANKLYLSFWDTMQETQMEEEAVDMAIEEELLHKFRSILTRLSPQQQKIMQLSIERKKVKEIAQILNVSENAVKMQKKRAYSAIRKELGECWSILLVVSFPHLF